MLYAVVFVDSISWQLATCECEASDSFAPAQVQVLPAMLFHIRIPTVIVVIISSSSSRHWVRDTGKLDLTLTLGWVLGAEINAHP